MTEISFHFNVPDATAYACRLLRKAARQGAVTVVTAAPATLEVFDRALWAFDPVEFVAHRLLGAGEAVPSRLRPTPIWLVANPLDAPSHDVLVNLGEARPEGFESFTRLIEIVSNDAPERLAARLRWRHYAARGYPIRRHEVVA